VRGAGAGHFVGVGRLRFRLKHAGGQAQSAARRLDRGDARAVLSGTLVDGRQRPMDVAGRGGANRHDLQLSIGRRFASIEGLDQLQARVDGRRRSAHRDVAGAAIDLHLERRLTDERHDQRRPVRIALRDGRQPSPP